MRYEGMVFRPPSEANSLIVQVTIGCSHNKCTFCSMYKGKQFRIRKLEEVLEDFEIARRRYRTVRRIFLADGDALILKTEHLEKILLKIKELFPECERVSSYATAQDINRKSHEELTRLNELGLQILYLGVESGSDEILEDIKKDTTAAEMIQAGQKAKKAGMKVSATLIIGVGGKEKSEMHAIESAKVLNQMDPDYLGLLSLTADRGTEMEEKVRKGEITKLSPIEFVVEIKKLIQNLELTKCVLRSNHASNHLALAGTMNEDKKMLLEQLDEVIEGKYKLRPNYFTRNYS
ncbi:radical SAM protein [Clostridium sediminicola]|uniref:radical SAM protein n=1 Tax=Clostridium sediminicola TaxID=3114879 RepID=UPI0031F20DBA